MSRVNVRKCVERALDSLSEESFDRFRNELVERRQEPRVTLNKVEKKRPFEVAKVMISTFKEDGALEVTKELLEEIGCSQDAEDMIKAAMEAGCCPPAAGGAAGAQTEGKLSKRLPFEHETTLQPMFCFHQEPLKISWAQLCRLFAMKGHISKGLMAQWNRAAPLDLKQRWKLDVVHQLVSSTGGAAGAQTEGKLSKRLPLEHETTVQPMFCFHQEVLRQFLQKASPALSHSSLRFNISGLCWTGNSSRLPVTH
ncbi:uncharacterized protein [Leuresthes tenuis]|uniref:uncharacterized protein n=1 Tax=Leuresthes tenuis TaxID=355514 RepID=UPI003B51316E